MALPPHMQQFGPSAVLDILGADCAPSLQIRLAHNWQGRTAGLSFPTAWVVRGCHGCDGFGSWAGVPLERSKVLMSALGHEERQIDTFFGKVREGVS